MSQDRHAMVKANRAVEVAETGRVGQGASWSATFLFTWLTHLTLLLIIKDSILTEEGTHK